MIIGKDVVIHKYRLNYLINLISKLFKNQKLIACKYKLTPHLNCISVHKRMKKARYYPSQI